jgi:hypothetical protein
VTITFDEDFTYSKGGLSFQLNCYSPEAANVDTTWQQYVIAETQGDNVLRGVIENWSGPYPDSEFYRPVVFTEKGAAFAALRDSNTIPAGYSLTIALNYDNAGNVAGATYSASDNNGNGIGSTIVKIVDQYFYGTTTEATTANLAPIVAIVLNIGGDGGGQAATITEGSGTIIYRSTNPMIPMQGEPAFAAFSGITEESSNIAFGTLPDTPDTVFSQLFWALL